MKPIEPFYVDGVNMNDEEHLLKVFPPYVLYCISCGLDFLHQTYGLGGGRASLICSDKCWALTQKSRREAKLAGPKDAT